MSDLRERLENLADQWEACAGYAARYGNSDTITYTQAMMELRAILDVIRLDDEDYDFVVGYLRSRESAPEEDARYGRLLTHSDEP